MSAEHALFRAMVDSFVPPTWAKLNGLANGGRPVTNTGQAQKLRRVHGLLFRCLSAPLSPPHQRFAGLRCGIERMRSIVSSKEIPIVSQYHFIDSKRGWFSRSEKLKSLFAG